MYTPELIALTWIEKLISIAIIFQTIELLQIKKVITNKGIWTWNIIKEEFEIFPKFIQRTLDIAMKYPNFLVVLYIRLVSAFTLLFISHQIPILLLLISTFLILLRWRGTFNGGSDYMTLIILTGITVASFFKSTYPIQLGCLWYIGLQACLSYFISGVVKIKGSNWRSGKALKAFLKSSNYDQSTFIDQLFNNKALVFTASWAVILLECLFPIALLDPLLCLAFISIAFIFHIGNFYVFGLNRFVFAWLASYPALYYCSGGF